MKMTKVAAMAIKDKDTPTIPISLRAILSAGDTLMGLEDSNMPK